MPDLSEDEDRELTNRKSSWELDPFWGVEIKFDVWMMVLVIFSEKFLAKWWFDFLGGSSWT